MELIYSDLALSQFEELSDYLVERFGSRVANKKSAELKAYIDVLKIFQNYSPVSIKYKSFTVRRLVAKKDYVFYTQFNNKIYVLAMFDTRMSPATMRKMVMQELNNINNRENTVNN